MNLRRVFLTLIGSGITTQMILFVGMLFLARLYTPSDFGTYGLYAGIASFSAVVSGLRFDYLAFRSNPSKNEYDVYYWAALLFSVATVLVALAITSALSSHFVQYPNFSIYATAFVLASSACLIGTQSLLARKNYNLYAKLRIIQAIAQIIIGMLLYDIEGMNGLIVGFILSQLAIGLVILLKFKPRFGSQARIKELVAREVRSAWLNTITTGLQYATPFAPILIGAAIYSPVVLGGYFLFSQLIAAPTAILRRSITSFLNAEFSDPARLSNEIALRRQKIIRVALSIFAIAACGLAIAAILRHEIVETIFGSEWSPQAELLVPLMIYYLFDTLMQPFTTLLALWGRSWMALNIEIARFAAVFGVTGYLAIIEESSYLNVIIGYAATMVVCYLISLIATMRVMYDRSR